MSFEGGPYGYAVCASPALDLSSPLVLGKGLSKVTSCRREVRRLPRVLHERDWSRRVKLQRCIPFLGSTSASRRVVGPGSPRPLVTPRCITSCRARLRLTDRLPQGPTGTACATPHLDLEDKDGGATHTRSARDCGDSYHVTWIHPRRLRNLPFHQFKDPSRSARPLLQTLPPSPPPPRPSTTTMASQAHTLYPRAQREDASQSSRLASMGRPPHPSSSFRPEDPRRSKTPGYAPAPAQPRTDRNFLVPRAEAPRTTADQLQRINDLNHALMMQAASNSNDQWQQQQPAVSHSRQSSHSRYYHPTTPLASPFELPHMRAAPIHRPSTAPPTQIRSVLAPPQERYKTPRPRSPAADYVHHGEFFCKRCNITFPEKQRFLEHMTYTHGIVRMPRP